LAGSTRAPAAASEAGIAAPAERYQSHQSGKEKTAMRVTALL